MSLVPNIQSPCLSTHGLLHNAAPFCFLFRVPPSNHTNLSCPQLHTATRLVRIQCHVMVPGDQLTLPHGEVSRMAHTHLQDTSSSPHFLARTHLSQSTLASSKILSMDPCKKLPGKKKLCQKKPKKNPKTPYNTKQNQNTACLKVLTRWYKLIVSTLSYL